MATLLPPPPRTPSPKVRIRSQSFDSPSSRISVTPIDDSPFSKSTGSINTFPSYNGMKAAAQRIVHGLLPLNTTISNECIMSDGESASSSSSSPTDSDGSVEMDLSDSPSSSSPTKQQQRQRPHPLTFTQTTTTYTHAKHVAPEPTSPFAYQDMSYEMYSPWLVRVVLDMYDVRGMDWMSIAEPIERVWGVRTSSADVLGILSANGRVGRRWWD